MIQEVAMTEKEIAMARFNAAKAEGLVDTKFFVVGGPSLSDEEIFAGMNRIDDARENGTSVKHESWAHDVNPTPFAPLLP